MAQVLLLSTAPGSDHDYNRGAFLRLRRSAERDPFNTHQLTGDPASADLILFAELKGAGPYFESVRRHSLVRKYREKCFLFCPNAFVIPFLPGVYANIERRWFSARAVSGFYLGVSENQFLRFVPPADNLPYLYSFVGSVRTATVRKELAKLVHPRVFFQDTSTDYDLLLNGKLGEEKILEFWRRYAQAIESSKFVLCPRGLGVSSVRLFDTMRVGRVPVIVSDDWVEPPGPDWSQFSIRTSESDVARIPSLLEVRESEAVRMGRLARKQWEKWFSEEVCFHRVIESCLQIKRQRGLPESWAHFVPYLQYLRPFHFRHFLRTRLQNWRDKWSTGRAESQAQTVGYRGDNHANPSHFQP